MENKFPQEALICVDNLLSAAYYFRTGETIITS
jgi:hypothetical protein